MKKSVGQKPFLLTHPVLVVSSYDKNEKPNMMAASWGGICCSSPLSICFSLRKVRHTYDCIMQHKAFVVNIPSEEYIKETDFSGIFSGKDMNKFDELDLTPIDAGIVHAPLIKEFPVSLICELSNTVEVGIHTMFIGKILDTLVDEEFMAGDIPDIQKIKPFIYDTSSRAYYGIGNKLIDAYTTNSAIKR